MSVIVVVVAVAVAVVFLFVYVRLWCGLSSKRHGARSRVRDASHRHHCCANIEDRVYCGVKLHL